MTIFTPPFTYDRNWMSRLLLELQQRLNNTRRADTDVEIASNGQRLILSSPDGTRWKIEVSNAGAITATAL